MIWKPHATVATVVHQNNRFLIVEERINGQTLFNQPAGHIEEGESIFSAALRETREETGWLVTLSHFLGIYTYKAQSNQQIYYRFCFAASSVENLRSPLDEGIIAAHWLTYDEITARRTAMRSPLVIRCIDDYLRNRFFPLDSITECF